MKYHIKKFVKSLFYYGVLYPDCFGHESYIRLKINNLLKYARGYNRHIKLYYQLPGKRD